MSLLSVISGNGAQAKRLFLAGDCLRQGSIRRQGFHESLPHLRSRRVQRNQILAFRFDKHATGWLVVEVEVAPLGDYVTYYGETVLQKRLNAHHIAERIRIGALLPDIDHWIELGDDPNEIAERIIELIETEANESYINSAP